MEDSSKTIKEICDTNNLVDTNHAPKVMYNINTGKYTCEENPSKPPQCTNQRKNQTKGIYPVL